MIIQRKTDGFPDDYQYNKVSKTENSFRIALQLTKILGMGKMDDSFEMDDSLKISMEKHLQEGKKKFLQMVQPIQNLTNRNPNKFLLSMENVKRKKKNLLFKTLKQFFQTYMGQGITLNLLPAWNGEECTKHFLHEVVDIIFSYIKKAVDRKSKVLDFHHPHQLLEGLEGFTLELSDHPEPLEQILVDCRDTLKYGVKTGHPRYFNQLSSGLDIIGLVGEWLTATANTNIISNLYSVLVARYKYYPEIKTKGMAALPEIILFISEHGKIPLYVSATAGTTVYGAFDPLANIADICEKYNLWLHVDASWGGGLLLSRKHSHKLSGIERANSVTWNPHKLMGVPLQCSAFLVHEKLCADYLFQPDKAYDTVYDTGDKSIQCGRHVDVFKLWLMWRAKGTGGFEILINKFLELAEYLYKELKTRNNYELIAPKIKARIIEEGTMMVSYQPLGDNVNFFRMVFSNPATKKA
ncbi:Glutamate decarboxylase 2, partial [Ophiophagus hannah]